MNQRDIPDWREVAKVVPYSFRDDGSSDPVIMYLLAMVPGRWSRRIRADINAAGRLHDWGYSVARLAGSGYECYFKDAWDAMYAQNIRDYGHPMITRIHTRALRWFGWSAWVGNWRQMQAWGWVTYQDFLDDADKSYTAKGGGAIA